MFGLVNKIRRWRLKKEPFPPDWLPHLEQHLPFFSDLEGEIREKFLTLVKLFVWEKNWAGAGGLEMTDEVKVVVAATAARLVIHLDLSFYDRLSDIVVYPSHFNHPDHSGPGVTLGEAHAWGTVVLSWEAVLHGLKNPGDGHDTATHEFAHVLDRVDGEFDGTPDLRRFGHYATWTRVMTRHFTALQGGKRKQRKVLRRYGATDEAEFFAVATESFFEKPRQMKKHTPDLYLELVRFYGFDPGEG